MSINLRPALAGACALAVSVAIAGPAGAVPVSTGPSTTVSPYLLPTTDAASITSLLTVDDQNRLDKSIDMVGIPDGLGAFKKDGNVVVYMNHELGGAVGAMRAHGERGAFVSRNVIDPTTGRVLSTSDLVQDVAYYDYTSGSYAAAPTGTFTAAFNRFCSSSLTDPGVLAGPGRSQYGYDGQVYFGNEENGESGRAFGITDDGLATQLPRLGLFSWENTLVADTGNRATVAIGTEDSANGQLRIYVGKKEKTGSAMTRAGLTTGTLHVLDLADQSISTDAGYRAAFGKGAAVPAQANKVEWNASATVQNIEAAAKGITLNRIEDGAFDPTNRNDFYFLTTEGGDKTVAAGSPTRDGGGLWRLRFENVKDPSAGMTLELLLDGSEAPFLNKPDNMDIDTQGHLLIQEDPGGNAHLARILAYDIASQQIKALAQFDPARFAPGATGYPKTIDEESSGIIDVAELMGPGTFLLDAQVHTSAGLSDVTRQVEHGQLLKMTVDWNSIF